jgi:hypothetical protein
MKGSKVAPVNVNTDSKQSRPGAPNGSKSLASNAASDNKLNTAPAPAPGSQLAIGGISSSWRSSGRYAAAAATLCGCFGRGIKEAKQLKADNREVDACAVSLQFLINFSK